MMNDVPTDVGSDFTILTHDQLQREMNYRVAMALLRRMRDAGLITPEEFVQIAPTFAEKFSPVWGDLYQFIA